MKASSTRMLAVGLACLIGLIGQPAGRAADATPAQAPILPRVAMLTEGQDFNIISPPRRTSVPPGQVEVIVFFSLDSAMAAEAVPYIEAWQESQDDPVAIRWQPVAMQPSEGYGARIFFALQLLDEESLVPDLIEACAAGKVRYEDTASIAVWLTAHGVDELAFARALDDGRTRAMAAWSPAVTGAYGVTSPLAFVVAGKYRVQASEQDPPPLAVAQAKYIVEHISGPASGG